jgi:Ca2+-binding RTX toxin-like protein
MPVEAEGSVETAIAGITYGYELGVAGDSDTFRLDLRAGVRYFWDVWSDGPALHLTSTGGSIYSGNIGGGATDFYTPTQNETALVTVSSPSGDTGGYHFYYQATITALPLLLGSSADDNHNLDAVIASEIWGWDGDDVLRGSAGADCLVGGRGNDVLAGRAGADRMLGGLGNDTYYVDAGDRVQESAGAGVDQVRSTVTHALAANVENLILTGAAAISGAGNAANNVLYGNAAANILSGVAGSDRLLGGAGNDRLAGGLGADRLTGGAGADAFVFAAASETPRAGRDAILDFAHGIDRIDLRGIDADTLHAGNQAFRFIGAQAFSGVAGQLHQQGGILSGDLNGDRVADFEIAVAALTASDILL